MERPQTRYVKSGDVSIAYQVFGEGDFDIVFVPPFVSTIELLWEIPIRAEGLRRLARSGRVITFDKRGTGLSDRVQGMPPLEVRMDDVRAVMDAAGSPRAALLGVSEGGPMSLLFAATYPDRCFALVLVSTTPRFAWAPDWRWGTTDEQREQAIADLERRWGSEELAADEFPWLSPDEQREMARAQRFGASPGAAAQLVRMNGEIDVRPVLGSISVPTLVLHRTGDPLDVRGARHIAEQVPGARFVELPGEAHGLFVAPDLDATLAEIDSFLREAWSAPEPEPERVLATVLFTDIVDSTAKAVELGDRRWADLVAAHHERVRRELARYRGRELDTAGDGFFAAFDGPARAIRCACAIREAVADLGVDVRAGLHTGECEQVDGKVAGVAVVTGARVASLAAPGEVLVTATVRDLVAGSGIAFEDRGLHALRGIPEERRLYAVR